MNEEHIDRVIKLYKERKTVEKTSYLASFEDIRANDFNLNIPRYVDSSEEEEEIDLHQLSQRTKATDEAVKQANRELLNMMEELTFSDGDIESAVKEFVGILKGE